MIRLPSCFIAFFWLFFTAVKKKQERTMKRD